MPVELIVPAVGESITEVEVGDWLKKEGELVSQDDPVVVLETEKVTVELPAPASGTVSAMLKRKGDKANVGDVIGYIEPNGVKAAAPSPSGSAPRDGAGEGSPPAPTVAPLSAAREEQIV